MKRLETTVPFDLEDMKRLYFDEHNSIIKIAGIYGSSDPTVWRYFKKNGIEMDRVMIFKSHKRTKEHSQRISMALKGRVHSEEQKQKIREGMLRAVANGHSGCFPKGHMPNITPERNEKISKARKGRKRPDITGSKHPIWRGGISFLYSRSYGNDIWDVIRKRILKRDRYECQMCGVKRKSLDVHHITPFIISRDDSDENLISLCRHCHMSEERKLQTRYFQRAQCEM